MELRAAVNVVGGELAIGLKDLLESLQRVFALRGYVFFDLQITFDDQPADLATLGLRDK